jgi:hypothetical protein
MAALRCGINRKEADMTNTPTKPGPTAIRAAVAIINSTVNPALRYQAVNANSRNLAEIIERETGVSALIAALQDAEQEIRDMLKDLCDEPEEDISAHRTLAKIRDALIRSGAPDVVFVSAPCEPFAKRIKPVLIGDSGEAV